MRSYDRRLNTPITWANQLKHLKLAFFFFFHFFENPLPSSRNCNTHTYKTINQNQRWQMFTQFPLKFFFFSFELCGSYIDCHQAFRVMCYWTHQFHRNIWWKLFKMITTNKITFCAWENSHLNAVALHSTHSDSYHQNYVRNSNEIQLQTLQFIKNVSHKRNSKLNFLNRSDNYGYDLIRAWKIW